jgi:hypothetical protein
MRRPYETQIASPAVDRTSAFRQASDYNRAAQMTRIPAMLKLLNARLVQELPMSTPVTKTKAPPSATCVAADRMGVSM